MNEREEVRVFGNDVILMKEHLHKMRKLVNEMEVHISTIEAKSNEETNPTRSN